MTSSHALQHSTATRMTQSTLYDVLLSCVKPMLPFIAAMCHIHSHMTHGARMSGVTSLVTCNLSRIACHSLHHVCSVIASHLSRVTHCIIYAVSSTVLHSIVMSCSVLHCVATCCSACDSLQDLKSVLYCVAVCCSLLQCVAMFCSVLQCMWLVAWSNETVATLGEFLKSRADLCNKKKEPIELSYEFLFEWVMSHSEWVMWHRRYVIEGEAYDWSMSSFWTIWMSLDLSRLQGGRDAITTSHEPCLVGDWGWGIWLKHVMPSFKHLIHSWYLMSHVSHVHESCLRCGWVIKDECVIWLIPLCDMTHSCVKWWSIHMCDMSHSYDMSSWLIQTRLTHVRKRLSSQRHRHRDIVTETYVKWRTRYKIHCTDSRDRDIGQMTLNDAKWR